MSWQSFLKSRIATWLLSAVLAFVLFFTARIFYQKHQIDKEIAKLQSETQKVKHDNEQLSILVKYLGTPEYQEKAAREKLNLKKDGEYVVGLPSNPDNADQTQTNAENKSNARQWFDYFFSPNP